MVNAAAEGAWQELLAAKNVEDASRNKLFRMLGLMNDVINYF